MIRITRADFIIGSVLSAVLFCGIGFTRSFNLSPTVQIFDYEGKKPIDRVPPEYRETTKSTRDRMVDNLIRQRDWLETNKEITRMNNDLKNMSVLLQKEDADSLKKKS